MTGVRSRAARPSEFVDQINGEVFSSAPWENADFDPQQLFAVVERSHRLFVPSRPLFGAMSFALEEVWLRNPSDSQLRDRARALSETVREAFIAYHKEKTPDFKDRLAARDDPLNAWITLEAGEFMMGADDLRMPRTATHRCACRLSRCRSTK